MEKLQTAIEKARAQRQRKPNLRAPVAVEDSAPAIMEIEGLWLALAPTTIPVQKQYQNLLVSHYGGDGAGAFDMLRTRILQQAQQNGWKRIALVSPHRGCGKTTVAANLAASFGRRHDLHTMVLDLDLRRPALAHALGQLPEYTMGNVLKGEIAFGKHAVRLGHNVALGLNSGPVETSSELLQTQKTRDVLDALEADYAPDIILFDMPPLLATDDNFGFLNTVDCALLIADAERTTVSQIDIAERQIAELTNMMGVVLNKTRGGDGIHEYGY